MLDEQICIFRKKKLNYFGTILTKNGPVKVFLTDFDC